MFLFHCWLPSTLNSAGRVTDVWHALIEQMSAAYVPPSAMLAIFAAQQLGGVED